MEEICGLAKSGGGWQVMLDSIDTRRDSEWMKYVGEKKSQEDIESYDESRSQNCEE